MENIIAKILFYRRLKMSGTKIRKVTGGEWFGNKD
jgi:hypothetical protein